MSKESTTTASFQCSKLSRSTIEVHAPQRAAHHYLRSTLDECGIPVLHTLALETVRSHPSLQRGTIVVDSERRKCFRAAMQHPTHAHDHRNYLLIHRRT